MPASQYHAVGERNQEKNFANKSVRTAIVWKKIPWSKPKQGDEASLFKESKTLNEEIKDHRNMDQDSRLWRWFYLRTRSTYTFSTTP